MSERKPVIADDMTRQLGIWIIALILFLAGMVVMFDNHFDNRRLSNLESVYLYKIDFTNATCVEYKNVTKLITVEDWCRGTEDSINGCTYPIDLPKEYIVEQCTLECNSYGLCRRVE